MSYWTVVQTKSQRERVAERCLTENGFTVYLPRIQTRTKTIEMLFPSYLFARIETHWAPINVTMGVMRVITNCEKPAVIRDSVIDEIRSREKGGYVRLPPRFELQRGSRVRILRGAFADQLAICDGMAGKDRTRVLLQALGRMVPVAIPTGYLQSV